MAFIGRISPVVHERSGLRWAHVVDLYRYIGFKETAEAIEREVDGIRSSRHVDELVDELLIFLAEQQV